MSDKRPQSQSKVFLEGEGDNWFERNKSYLASQQSFHDVETIARVLQPFKPDIKTILEIGCSNGAKLLRLCDVFSARGEGVDPSSAAVTAANDLFKQQAIDNIHLQTATAAALPFDEETFDLVYFGFCLYLVDRGEIYRAVAEADRVLKKGGFLAILDFDPAQRHKRPYLHKSGIYSFKSHYADFFTIDGHYHLVAKESYSHALTAFSKNSDERVAVSVLYKEPDPYAAPSQ